MTVLIRNTETSRTYWQDENLYYVGQQHVNQLKGVCLQARSSPGFLATLFCCEQWQELQVHRLYREHPKSLKLQLDWEMRYIVNLTMKIVSISEILVLWGHLTPVSAREISTLLQHGWHEVDEAFWLVKNNVQAFYMHKRLILKDVRKNAPKEGDS